MKVVFTDAPHDVVMVAAVDPPLQRIVGEKSQTIMHRSGKAVVVGLVAAVMIADEHISSHRSHLIEGASDHFLTAPIHPSCPNSHGRSRISYGVPYVLASYVESLTAVAEAICNGEKHGLIFTSLGLTNLGGARTRNGFLLKATACSKKGYCKPAVRAARNKNEELLSVRLRSLGASATVVVFPWTSLHFRLNLHNLHG